MNESLLSLLLPLVVIIGIAILLDIQLFRWRKKGWLERGAPDWVEQAGVWVDRSLASVWVRLRKIELPRRGSAPAGEAITQTDALPSADLTEKDAAHLVESIPAGQESPQTIEVLETRPPPADQVGRSAHVNISLDIPEGMTVRLTVETLGDGQAKVSTEKAVFAKSSPSKLPTRPNRLSRLQFGWLKPLKPLGPRLPLATVLFIGALLLYTATRLIGLTRFPVYFFTDEAIHTISAADLVRDHFKNGDGVFLPTYFKNGNYYNLSASVYIQVIPYLLFGRSAVATRAVSALISLLSAVGVAVMLRDVFKVRFWWVGVLLLTIAPAWFLHSRTAFEASEFTSFYAITLCCYMLYRYRSPNYLYPTLILAGISFYTYSPGQMVIALTGVLLFFSDLRYHWQNRRMWLWAIILVGIVAIPYLRFRLKYPDAALDHLRNLGSYWLEPSPLSDKIKRYITTYGYGLSPEYWFIPNVHDFSRHLMKGYGNLLLGTLPFTALGLVVALWNIRSSAHRAVLIALLATPAGAALVDIGITRALAFVIPATLLTGLGLSRLLEWLTDPSGWPSSFQSLSIAKWLEKNPMRYPAAARQNLAAVMVFIVLAVSSFSMLRDALVNGPTWYSDYGMGGVQYGAFQVFDVLKAYRNTHPDARIIFSPNWANGTDIVGRFFLGDNFRLEMGSVYGYIDRKLPLDDNTVFVMIPEEYARVVASNKFTDLRVEQTVPCPDGIPCFSFVRMRYVDNVEAILAAEKEVRRQLQEADVMIDGQMAHIRFSMLDMGEPQLLFDGDLYSVARTLEANPFVVEVTFAEPRQINGMSVRIGSSYIDIRALLYSDPNGTPVEYKFGGQGRFDQPDVSIDFPETVIAKLVRLEMQENVLEPAHVHIWEITFK